MASVRVICPECEEAFRIDDDAGSRKVQCPECGTRFVANRNGPSSRDRDEEDLPRRRTRKPRKSGKNSSNLVIALVLGGILLTGGAVTGILWATGAFSTKKSGGPETATGLENNPGSRDAGRAEREKKLGWQLDEALARDSLGTEEPIATYKIRAPTAARLSMTTHSSKLWEIMTDRSGTFIKVIVTLDAGPVTTNDLIGSIERDLESTKRTLKDFRAENVETGTLNGIPFARAHWSGTHETHQGAFKQRGFMYFGVDGKTTITVTAFTTELNTYPMLEKMEAAVLSIKK